MKDDVVVEVIIALSNSADQLLKAMKSPAVNILKMGIGNKIPIRVKIEQVAQQVTTGVADTAVGLAQSLEDLFGKTNVIPIVLTSDP